MRNAICFSPRLQEVSWKWLVRMLWGNCPMHMEDEALDCMAEHDFKLNCPAFFLVLTPGKGEDSWTPKSNGMINCSEQIDLDDLGFLNKDKSDKISNDQREGRVGRVAHRNMYLKLLIAKAIKAWLQGLQEPCCKTPVAWLQNPQGRAAKPQNGVAAKPCSGGARAAVGWSFGL